MGLIDEVFCLFPGNRAAYVALDEGDEDEDCCSSLVFLQPTIKSIPPLFSCVKPHPKYPGYSCTCHKWHLFLGNISLSGL